jgi:predicted nucleic acid-binding protein
VSLADAWVVDASVAAKWYLRDEEHAAPSLALLRSYQQGLTALIAPHFIRYEVARSLLRAGQQARLSEEDARQQLEHFLRLGIHTEEDPDSRLLAAQALSRSLRVGFYDALYLALAEDAGFRFVTADAELYHRVRDDLPYVTWIGDVPPS